MHTYSVSRQRGGTPVPPIESPLGYNFPTFLPSHSQPSSHPLLGQVASQGPPTSQPPPPLPWQQREEGRRGGRGGGEEGRREEGGGGEEGRREEGGGGEEGRRRGGRGRRRGGRREEEGRRGGGEEGGGRREEEGRRGGGEEGTSGPQRRSPSKLRCRCDRRCCCAFPSKSPFVAFLCISNPFSRHISLCFFPSFPSISPPFPSQSWAAFTCAWPGLARKTAHFIELLPLTPGKQGKPCH